MNNAFQNLHHNKYLSYNHHNKMNNEIQQPKSNSMHVSYLVSFWNWCSWIEQIDPWKCHYKYTWNIWWIWMKIIINFQNIIYFHFLYLTYYIYTCVTCAVGPSVTTSSTDFSFQNLVFGNLFEFSMVKIT